MYMQTPEEKLIQLLPDSIDEWTKWEADEFFNSDNLYDYIDGGAELYLSYGFNLVLKRIYSADGQPDITVDIFEMTSSKNAFGVYSHSRETIEHDYGQGSFNVEGAILFWKDKYFISIITFPETPKSRQAIEGIARRIDSSIESTGELPPVLKTLPEENLLEESVVYFKHSNWQNTYYFISNENIFNISNSTECVLAKYKINDDKPILMILEYANESEAESTIDNLKRKFAYEELNDGLDIQLDDKRWIRIDRQTNLVYMVINAGDTGTAKSLLKITAAQVQNYIEHN
jgi:hypothetical protein